MNDDRPIESISSIRPEVDSTLDDAGLKSDRGMKHKSGEQKNFGKMLKDAREHKGTGEEE